MINVRLISNWNKPDLIRQTPGQSGIWDGIKFTFEKIPNPDYAIVLNFPPNNISINTCPENVWCIVQEPASEYFKHWHMPRSEYYRVFTSNPALNTGRYINSPPYVPWLINKTYDQLLKEEKTVKNSNITWITSTKTFTAGHKKRMKLFHDLAKMVQDKKLDIDLTATAEYLGNNSRDHKKAVKIGFNNIAKDKWSGLISHKYALAIENFSSPYYWTEKITDCYLTRSFPIYYGCTNITDYFPKESFEWINLDDKGLLRKIRQIAQSNLYEKRKELIAKAKDIVLRQQQFFPFFTAEIKAWENKKSHSKRQTMVLRKPGILRDSLRQSISKINNMFS